ncbi:MAG: hypothetical protein QM817_12515 [Archangium sp.]
MGRAWVLNLDAEDELAHGRAHTPAAAIVERVQRLIPTLSVLAPGDVVVFPGDARADGLPGVAWSPTRWALEQLQKSGAIVPPAPSMDVLRKVNHRRFSHDLGTFLPNAAYVTTAVELLTHLQLDRDAWWVAKRPFAYAGRGRKRLRFAQLNDSERAWIDASFRDGEGVQLEPWVNRTTDCALHGEISMSGDVTLGAPTLQELDQFGAWLASRRAEPGELTAFEVDQLVTEAKKTADALKIAGYFGPFGIDGFRWTDSHGAHFQPRSEINARYSMGWAVGMLNR